MEYVVFEHVVNMMGYQIIVIALTTWYQAWAPQMRGYYVILMYWIEAKH